MKNKYILQNGITKKYWYGFYTNKQWTDDIVEAKQYDALIYLEQYVNGHPDEFGDMLLIPIQIWV